MIALTLSARHLLAISINASLLSSVIALGITRSASFRTVYSVASGEDSHRQASLYSTWPWTWGCAWVRGGGGGGGGGAKRALEMQSQRRGRVRGRDESAACTEGSECPVCMESTATVSMCRPYACTHSICTGCNRETYVRSDDRCPICRAGRTARLEASIGRTAIEERERRRAAAARDGFPSAAYSRFGTVFLPIEPPLAARTVRSNAGGGGGGVGGVAIIARVGRMHPSQEVERDDDRVPLDGLEYEGGFEIDHEAADAAADADWEMDPHDAESLPRLASDDVGLLLSTPAGASVATDGSMAREARTPFSRLLVSTLHRDPAVRDALFRLVHFGASAERRPRRQSRN